MSNPDEAHYLILVKGSHENEVFILASADENIRGFASIEKAKGYFLKTYEKAHSRSYEGSMSACIHFLTYQPRIVYFKDIEEITNQIAAEEPHFFELHTVAGTLHGISCRKEAYKLWEEGIAPPLITERE